VMQAAEKVFGKGDFARRLSSRGQEDAGLPNRAAALSWVRLNL
jgi:hypothetical protein